ARAAWERAGLAAALSHESPAVIRAAIEAALMRNKIVGAHYQHVDGTSFAAPIVSSVVAQMLEANPNLTPAAVKHILISTASRIAGAPLIWQGYGMLKARRALEMATRQQRPLDEAYYRPPLIEGEKLVFFYHNDAAESVALAGEFNDWDPARTPFTKDGHGVWRAEIDAPPPGRYAYKFVINQQRWLDDPSNGLKEDDQHGGLNSVLNIN
ncbi:MAG TPA: S8 family serine peptidase, partial [Blastocatellia bacterium]|nr:S8 family serine peptidase [Blastocatellia bacterium]